jgi:hypothetical protein
MFSLAMSVIVTSCPFPRAASAALPASRLELLFFRQLLVMNSTLAINRLPFSDLTIEINLPRPQSQTRPQTVKELEGCRTSMRSLNVFWEVKIFYLTFLPGA